jgi:formylglycine-generating enzyme required for sulfatase activity
MIRSFCNRADLVRVLSNRDSLLVDAAEFLGYEKLPGKPVQNERDEDHTDVPIQASSAIAPLTRVTYDSNSWPENQTPLSFWILNYYAQQEIAIEESPPQRRELVWREQQKGKAPRWDPICEWSSLVPRLRAELTQASCTARIDVPQAVKHLAEGQWMHNIPRQSVRRWGDQLELIIDRSQRLIPFHQDQDWFLGHLQSLMPRSSIQLVLYDEARDRLLRVDSRGSVARYTAPDTRVPIVILSDLDALSVHSTTTIWQDWSEEWQPREAPVLAVVPCSPSLVRHSVRRSLCIIPWQKLVLTQNSTDAEKRKSLVDELFRFLAPAKRVQPGLLRAVRRSMPDAADASLEVDFWQDARLVSRHLRGATCEPEVQSHFIKLSIEDRQRALQCIRNWRYELAPEIWMSEIWGLDAESESLLSDSDREDARAWQESLVAMKSDEASDAMVAWLARATSNLQDQALARQPDLRKLHRRVHKHSDLLGGHPSELERGEEIQFAIGQSGDSLAFYKVDSAEIKKPTFHLHGFARTYTHTLSVTELEWRDDTGFWKDGVAPIWAKDWGWDEFGPWAEFEVQGKDGQAVRQRLRWIPPGEFVMGSPKDEADRESDEVQHSVTLSRGYWMFDTSVTQELWRAIVGTEPSHFQGAQLPVEEVSWKDSQDFLVRLNERLGGEFMTLPTEAQWEYACRAGTETPYSFGSVCDGTQANCDGNYPYGTKKKGPYLAKTSPVRSYPANAWGLFDMHGNVWEWCNDWYRAYSTSPAADPHGPNEGHARVLRGGCWYFYARNARSACRYYYGPGDRIFYIGFRCAQVLGAAEPTRADGGRRRRLHPTSGGAGARVFIQPQQASTTPLPEGAAVRVESDVDVLELTRITKPEWASAMGRDRYGLWAEFTLEIPANRKSKKGSKRPKSSASPSASEGDFVTQRMRWIPPGRFLMGSTESDDQVLGSEQPVHEVTLNYGYWLFDTPVTQALWQVIVPENPSRFKGSRRPVERVSWDDCQQFLIAINKHFAAKQIDLELVLPTEAEWEYACRAGTTTRYSFGDSISLHQANYFDSSLAESQTSDVKKFASNPWGLYDMHGNVWEWCQDWYGEYTNDATRNPLGPSGGHYRVLRGGSWSSDAQLARSACRRSYGPGDRYSSIGFRCAQVQKESRVSEQANERLATSGSEASK